ncbi:30S ribosomal protein S9 [Desulforhabdus amnigena]|uniref:Small ribosomal subunit protein uS9 n=1 Tax=Desulforhabdus amnigena TaxID=40218 RepID=A0A9W6D3P8_9BACT|nr:30S ribosomal protein S9 [Desulforhabdus amnigena]NLJ28229.1 30S ribosomal protein S9 [Deltaproteobacteria bacterium]GLI33998.1 30S ribosomal protein S9 [Desulforhabdus amnigena]
MAEQRFSATGKRKTAVARVWLQPGSGVVVINKKPMDSYVDRETSKMVIFQPLVLTGTYGKLDVSVNVQGGGGSGQAGAIRHGISKALLEYNPEFREVLKRAGFLTRDSRVKERKKYGKRSARARFQYSKR